MITMYQIELHEFYHEAAEHFDEIMTLLHSVATEIPAVYDDQKHAFLSFLDNPDHHNAVAALAAVKGMDTSRILSPVIVHMCARHRVRNIICGLINPAVLLERSSETRRCVKELLERYHIFFP